MSQLEQLTDAQAPLSCYRSFGTVWRSSRYWDKLHDGPLKLSTQRKSEIRTTHDSLRLPNIWEVEGGADRHATSTSHGSNLSL